MCREPLFELDTLWPSERPVLVKADLRSQVIGNARHEASALSLEAAVELDLL